MIKPKLRVRRKPGTWLSDEEKLDLLPAVEKINNGLLKKEIGVVIEVGHALIEVQEKLKGEGKWRLWLRDELQSLSFSTAENYVRAARFCDQYGYVTVTRLPSVTALFRVSRKKVPTEQLNNVLAELAEGPVTSKRLNQLMPKPVKEPEPDPKKSEKEAITKEQLEELRLDTLRQLMKNETLFRGLIHAIKFKGVRITISAFGRSIDLITVEEIHEVVKFKHDKLDPADPVPKSEPWDGGPFVP